MKARFVLNLPIHFLMWSSLGVSAQESALIDHSRHSQNEASVYQVPCPKELFRATTADKKNLDDRCTSGVSDRWKSSISPHEMETIYTRPGSDPYFSASTFHSKNIEYGIAACAKDYSTPSQHLRLQTGQVLNTPGTKLDENDQFNAVSDYYSYMGSMRAHSKFSLDSIASINRWLGNPVFAGTGRLDNNQLPGLGDQAAQIMGNKACTEAAPLEYDEILVTTLDSVRALQSLDNSAKNIAACNRRRNSGRRNRGHRDHEKCKEAQKKIEDHRTQILDTSPWMKTKAFKENLEHLKRTVNNMEYIHQRRSAELAEAKATFDQISEKMQAAANAGDRPLYDRLAVDFAEARKNYSSANEKKSKSATLYVGNVLRRSLLEMRDTLKSGLDSTIAASACIHGQEYGGKPQRPGCLSTHYEHLDSLPVIEPPRSIVEDKDGTRHFLRGEHQNSIKLASAQLGIASCRRSIRSINKTIDDAVGTFAIHSSLAIGTLGLGTVISASMTAAKTASAAGWMGRSIHAVNHSRAGQAAQATSNAIGKIATPTVRAAAGAGIISIDTYYLHESSKDVYDNCIQEVEAEINSQPPATVEELSCSGVEKVAGLSLELAVRNCKQTALFATLDIIPFVGPTGRMAKGTYRGTKAISRKIVEFVKK